MIHAMEVDQSNQRCKFRVNTCKAKQSKEKQKKFFTKAQADSLYALR